MVKAAWDRLGGLEISDKLGQCGEAVWEWGNRLAKEEGRELRRCKETMGRLRGLVDGNSVRAFGECQVRFLQLLQNQSDKWRQRAKDTWYSEGDRNTRFFHNFVNLRRRRNAIVQLRDYRGGLVTGEQEMGQVMTAYFTK